MIRRNRLNRKSKLSSEDKIYRAHELYSMLVMMGLSIITVIVLIGGYFTFTSVSDLKNSLRSEMDDFKKQLLSDVKADIDSQIMNINTSVRSKIETEFEQEKIHGLINNVAQERVDNIADELIERNISDKINPKLNSIDSRLEKSIEESNLNLLFIKAQNDSRGSLEKLKALSNNPSYMYRNEAKKYYNQVYTENLNTVEFWYWIDEKTRGIDISKYNFKEMRELYEKSSMESKRVIIDEVWLLKEFSKADKIIFLLAVLKSDESISATKAAAQYLIEEAKLSFNLMEWDKIIKHYSN